ncbi:unnamed protein product [Schistocephalus solidus]|uniref:Reverse transcriptase domain-containing protein n=1 Tax=Schistocephalus solidus TaxID=70667 RepID=A0A183SGN8_SCHSO|nr:unnamed protein product [Schistocephalus solidus]
MLTGTEGTAAYLDDIIVTGSDPYVFLQRLETVLSRIQDYGFACIWKIAIFFMPSVKYLGFIINQDGCHPDSDNIDAIKQMPPLKDVYSLHAFLGLLSHYGSFLPDMHRLRYLMNELLKKNVKWIWSRECQQAIEEGKVMLNFDLLLTHFNPDLKIVVAEDVSKYGIGTTTKGKTSKDLPGYVEERAASVVITELTIPFLLVKMDDCRVLEILRNPSLAPHLLKYCCKYRHQAGAITLTDFRWDFSRSLWFPSRNVLNGLDNFWRLIQSLVHFRLGQTVEGSIDDDRWVVLDTAEELGPSLQN